MNSRCCFLIFLCYPMKSRRRGRGLGLRRLVFRPKLLSVLQPTQTKKKEDGIYFNIAIREIQALNRYD